MRVGLRLALLALLVAPGAALGQQIEACRPPVLEVQQPWAQFRSGSSADLLMAIENPNGPPVDNVRGTITTTTPPGWTAIPAQRDFTLGPSNVSLTALAVTAPSRGSGAASGNITIFVTFFCSTGETMTTASSSEILGVSIEAIRTPWPLVLGFFAVLVLGVGALGVRRLRRGVALVVTGDEREVVAGKSVKFTFLVENRRGKPQRLRLVVGGLPEGWSLHLALTDVDLQPGEEKTLWAILKAPPHAPTGLDLSVGLTLADPQGQAVATGALHARVAPS